MGPVDFPVQISKVLWASAASLRGFLAPHWLNLHLECWKDL